MLAEKMRFALIATVVVTLSLNYIQETFKINNLVSLPACHKNY